MKDKISVQYINVLKLHSNNMIKYDFNMIKSYMITFKYDMAGGGVLVMVLIEYCICYTSVSQAVD